MDDGILDIRQAYKLDNLSRIRELKPYELLKNVAGVVKGWTCIDFGSGTGVFALPMADLVGDEGKVYAIDKSIEMLGHIRAKNPPPNLIMLHSNVERTGLNGGIADLCLLAFILHEVKQPGNIITEAFRLLKPDGRLLIIEWKADFDSPGPPRKSRISQEQLKQLFGKVGLAQVNYIDWTRNHYVAIVEEKNGSGGI